MDGTALVTVDDLAARLGVVLEPDTTEYDRAAAVLLEASVLAAAEAGPVGEAWTADTVPAQVAVVVRRSAARVFTNPSGAAQTTTGPYSISWSSTSQAYLSRDEKRLVRRAAGRTGLATIRTERDDTVADEMLYVDTDPGSEPVLYYASRDVTDLGWAP